MNTLHLSLLPRQTAIPAAVTSGPWWTEIPAVIKLKEALPEVASFCHFLPKMVLLPAWPSALLLFLSCESLQHTSVFKPLSLTLVCPGGADGAGFTEVDFLYSVKLPEKAKWGFAL